MHYSDLNRHCLADRSGRFERPVWTFSTGGAPVSTAIAFLDGELYIERVQAAQVVRQLVDAQLIPSVAALFVSNAGAVNRHKDYICCPDYARFIAEDLVELTSRQFPGVRQIVLAGLSLSGLSAAYIGTRYPEIFRSVICQSPSFWWERGRFADDLPPATHPDQQFWICVGSGETDTGVSHPPSGLLQDMTQIAGCASAVAALRARGYQVSDRQYDGGHDPNCWREDLSLALPRMLRPAQ